MTDRYFEYGVPNLTNDEGDELDRRLLATIDAYLAEPRETVAGGSTRRLPCDARPSTARTARRPMTCHNCHQADARRKGLCDPCYQHRRRTGTDRPETNVIRHNTRRFEQEIETRHRRYHP